MIEKDPTAWGQATWFVALGFAFAGGIVNFYARVKSGHTRAFNLIELVGEIFTSGFVGLLVFTMMVNYDFPVGLCAAASGIGGHMATRLLFAAEKLLEGRLQKTVDGLQFPNLEGDSTKEPK